MRVWPDTLPGPILPGYDLSPVDPARRTQMEGAVRVRRMSLARQDIVQVPWLFTDREFVLFRQWFGDELITALGDSDDLTGWSLSEATVVADSIVGPDGVLADRLRDTAVDASHFAERAYAGAVADDATLFGRATIRAAGRSFARLTILTKAAESRFATIDLATGAVVGSSGIDSAVVTDRGGGWWRLTVLAGAGVGVLAPRLRINAMATSGTLAHLGDGTSGVDVCEVQGRISDGYDGFAHTDATGAAQGAGGGSAWVRLPLIFGGGLSTVEARPTGVYRARPGKGLYWNVTCGFEVRNA